MLVLPEIVVLNGVVDAQQRRAGSGFIVHIEVPMQRQPVFDLESQVAGARLRSGSNDGIDLPVGVGVGAVQLRLQPAGVEQHVGAEAGQGAPDIVRAEIAIA